MATDNTGYHPGPGDSGYINTSYNPGVSTQPSFNFDANGNLTTATGLGVQTVSGNQTSGGYDADGYPLPPAGQGYDPTMPPPLPSSEDPFNLQTNPLRPGETPEYRQQQEHQWQQQQQLRQQNQQNKQTWQQQHASMRHTQQAPAAQAPAFQSAGVDLTKAGTGEQYAQSILNHYQGNVPGTSNNAQSLYDQFSRSAPADMSAYYDNAQRLQDNAINTQMAARGSYGSSNAIGQLAAADTNLRAQQARDEAAYGLQRYSAAGSLANSADQQANVANGIQFQWTKGLSDIADQEQNLSQDRNQQLWTNNLNLANLGAGITGAAGNAAISGAGSATDAYENALQGKSTDQLSAANSNANTDATQMTNTLNSLGTAAKNYKYQDGQF